MVIAFVNGKGGVGKTTLSLMVAAALRNVGHNATIEDRDPQASATVLAPNLGVPISGKGDIVIIDTAPRLDHPPTIDAIRHADKVVVVSSPSPADLSTTVETARLISIHRLPENPTRILFNSVVANTRLALGIEKLKSQLPFPSLPNHLIRRQSYQLATLQGWAELNGEAREEIKTVAIDILLM